MQVQGMGLISTIRPDDSIRRYGHSRVRTHLRYVPLKAYEVSLVVALWPFSRCIFLCQYLVRLGFVSGYEGYSIQGGTQGIHLSHTMSVLSPWVMSYEPKPVAAFGYMVWAYSPLIGLMTQVVLFSSLKCTPTYDNISRYSAECLWFMNCGRFPIFPFCAGLR